MYRLILLLAIALIITGCGSQTTSSNTTAPQDLSTLPQTIDIETTDKLRTNPDVVLIDVRTPEEFAAGHIPGVTLIPMDQIQTRLSEIPKDKTVIFTCRSGNRSGQVTTALREQGFANVHNMQGGLNAWQGSGKPVER